MSDLLFAVPWWIPTLLVLIGIALFVKGHKSALVAARNAGAGLVLLAIIWAVVSYLVDTDKEKVEKGTRQFVQAAVDGAVTDDWKGFKSRLMPQAALTYHGRTYVTGADSIIALTREKVREVGLKSADVQHLTVEQNGPHITARCDIYTKQDITPQELSSWEFVWEQAGDGWKIREIRLIEMRGFSGDDFRGFTPRSK